MPEVTALPPELKHIHIMGIGGTAMAALAGLLVDAGYRVTGSDGNIVYPPMSDVLADIGIAPMVGYNASNLSPRPDLVIVGNVIRAVYEEAQELIGSDIPYMSFPSLLGSMFLEGKKSIVVAGTHGKTTTTSIIAWLLEAAQRKPGFLIGGLTSNFSRTARAAEGDFFSIEGDEYDTAFFDKGPKFLHYRPHTAILTSVEFDHADIYRDLAHCQESFKKLTRIMPEDGCIVARWDHDSVVECVQGAPCEVRSYGPGQQWDGRIENIDISKGMMQFAVLHDGKLFGRFHSTMVGEHNLYNQVAAAAALSRYGISAEELAQGFSSFRGIRRRQELVAEPFGVAIIDDFAHHPTAIRLTLEGLRMKYGGRRLWAIFEPRSATSRRNTLQSEFAAAFDSSDIALIAPPYDLSGIPPAERLDVETLLSEMRGRGVEAFAVGAQPQGMEQWSAAQSADAIADTVVSNIQPEDVVAVMSNGGFGGIHQKLVQKITNRFLSP
jgi:UDP-N-acetylmuramate: L-alanyl-gamma-D-glutamyl-meso-diaminopimelate ligase